MSLDVSDITKPVKGLYRIYVDSETFNQEQIFHILSRYLEQTQVIEKLWRETVRKPTELRKTVKHSEKLEKKSEKKMF